MLISRVCLNLSGNNNKRIMAKSKINAIGNIKGRRLINPEFVMPRFHFLLKGLPKLIMLKSGSTESTEWLIQTKEMNAKTFVEHFLWHLLLMNAKWKLRRKRNWKQHEIFSLAFFCLLNRWEKSLVCLKKNIKIRWNKFI